MDAFYNDPDLDYQKYWQTRQYEHQSEVLAIEKFLKDKRFVSTVDIGGGYGRLTEIVARYTDTVLLLEPSAKMRILAKKKFKILAGSAQKTNLPDASVDLVTCFRVLHHIPDLSPVFAEFARILKPNGYLVFEFANSLNFKAQIRSLITGKPVLLTPIDLRSLNNIRNQSIPFVNHHPETVFKIMTASGFVSLQTLSVSNFRQPLLKKLIPFPLLIDLENKFQKVLAALYFGPSIFVLAKRVDSSINL